MTRSRVLLPHPDGPMRETNSPSATSRLISARASKYSPRVEYTIPTPLMSMAVPEGRSLGSGLSCSRVRALIRRRSTSSVTRISYGYLLWHHGSRLHALMPSVLVPLSHAQRDPTE